MIGCTGMTTRVAENIIQPSMDRIKFLRCVMMEMMMMMKKNMMMIKCHVNLAGRIQHSTTHDLGTHCLKSKHVNANYGDYGQTCYQIPLWSKQYGQQNDWGAPLAVPSKD